MSQGSLASHKTDLLSILCLYILAHGWLLLNNGLYWDDWAITGAGESLREAYRDAGHLVAPYYHLVLDRVGVPAYKLVSFLGHLISACCLYAVLARISEIDRKTRLLLVLFFVLFPATSARVSIGVSWYVLCYTSFFAGLWLLSVYLDTRAPALRIASLVLLFASFLTHSLLVFYAVVPAYMAYRARSEIRTLPALRGWALRHADFLLLPILFWALRAAWFVPHGTYRGYNRVTPESALEALSFLDNALLGAFLEPLVESLGISPVFLVPAAILAVLGARLLSRLDTARPADARPHAAWFVLAGLALFALAVFPYLAVGKVPSLRDWDSRHQLLTPLGASFLLVYLPRLLPRGRVQNLIHAALVVAFVAWWMHTWLELQKDWYKQVGLIESFKADPLVARGTHFLFEDRATELNAMQRQYRGYEYSGLFRAAFGDEKRQARSRGGQPVEPPWNVIVIEHGPLALTVPEVFRLRMLESSDARTFRERVKGVVAITSK